MTVVIKNLGRAADLSTHHDVWRMHDGSWLKVARDHGVLTSEKIVRERAVWVALGRGVVSAKSWDGREAMITDHMGEPLEESLSLSLADEMCSALENYGLVLAPAAVPDGNRWMSSAVSTISGRLTGPDMAHLSSWCIARASLGTFPLTGKSLVHTDPHPGNWVRDDVGKLHLIDWESARRGSASVDQAALYLAAAIAGEEDVATALLRKFRPDAAFSSAFKIKSALAMSWLAWHTRRTGGDVEAAVAARHKVLRDADDAVMTHRIPSLGFV